MAMSSKKSRFQSARKDTVKAHFFDYGANPKAVRRAIDKADDHNFNYDHIVDEPKKILIVRKEDQLHLGKRLLTSVITDYYSPYYVGEGNYKDNLVIQESFADPDTEAALVVESLHVNKEPVQEYTHYWKQCEKEYRDKRVIVVLALPEYIQSLFRLHEYSVIIAPDEMIDNTATMTTAGELTEIPVENVALGDQHQEFVSIDDDGNLMVMNSENNGSATKLSEKPVEKRGWKNSTKRFLKETWLFYAKFLDLGYRFETDNDSVVYDPSRIKKKNGVNKRENKG